MSPKKAGCLFKDVSQKTTTLLRTYYTYVINGNTPLTDLPYYISEVGEMLKDTQARKKLADILDREEKEKSRELMKSYGI